MLVLGPLGMLWATKAIWLEGEEEWRRSLAGVVAGWFYLLNLGTVQNFYVPFEPFVTFYGFLPWLIGWWVKVLEGGKRRDWLVFLGLSKLL